MINEPYAAIIIVSYNTRDLLIQAVSSVFAVTAEHPAEIVVVDNGSTDGSLDAIRDSYPAVKTIGNQHNVGFAAACNQGIRATVAPLILLLNSDARLTAEAFTAMIDCIESDQRCAAAGCAMVDFDGASRTNTWVFLNPLNQAIEYLVPATSLNCRCLQRTRKPVLDRRQCDSSVDWIDAGCMMLRRTAVEEIGLFDERFFMYSEDEDLCFRLRQQGWSICYSAAGSAAHLGGASSSQQRSRMLEQFYLSQSLFLAKHKGVGVARIFFSLNRFALKVKRLVSRQRRAEANERLHALNNAQHKFPSKIES